MKATLLCFCIFERENECERGGGDDRVKRGERERRKNKKLNPQT